MTAGLAALLLAALGTAGCRSDAQAAPPAAATSPSPSPSGPLARAPWAAPFATAAIPTGAGPQYMVDADGATWVENHRGGTLERIDPATNTVTDSVLAGGELWDPLAYLFGSLWIVSGVTGHLVRVDPKTRQVTGSVWCGCYGAKLFKYGDLLLASTDHDTAFFDPATMNVIRRAPIRDAVGDRQYNQVNVEIIGWALVGDDVWFLGENLNQIYRMSLATLKIDLVAPVPVLALEYINGRLLAMGPDGRLRQVDPSTGKVMTSWQLAWPDKVDDHGGLDVFDDGTGNGVWVNEKSTQLTHLDLTTGQTRTITGLPYQPEANPEVIVANGTMWLSDWKDDLVLRMKP
jgi:hypothetical protein